MKFELKRTPEQVELVKLMASSNRQVAYEAQAAISMLLAPLVAELYLQADITNLIYKDIPFNEGEDPAFPIDLYQNQPEGYNTIWMQNIAGGVPSNFMTLPVNEVRFTTFQIESAISYLKKYAALARLDVVAKGIERLMQEINLKQQRNAWAPFFANLANASYTSLMNNGGTPLKNVFRSANPGFFSLADLNKMFTALRRLNSSWVGGTTTESSALTDLFISPEIKEQIRGFAYQPVNTLTANNQTPGASSGVVTLPDAEREKIWNAAGVESIFNVALHELNELGVGYKFTQLFQAMAGSNTYTNYTGGGSATFNSATSDLVIGIDANKEVAFRPVEIKADSGSEFSLVPDDQFLMRSQKLGWWGAVTEGRVIIDSRPYLGVIV